MPEGAEGFCPQKVCQFLFASTFNYVCLMSLSIYPTSAKYHRSDNRILGLTILMNRTFKAKASADVVCGDNYFSVSNTVKFCHVPMD